MKNKLNLVMILSCMPMLMAVQSADGRFSSYKNIIVTSNFLRTEDSNLKVYRFTISNTGNKYLYPNVYLDYKGTSLHLFLEEDSLFKTAICGPKQTLNYICKTEMECSGVLKGATSYAFCNQDRNINIEYQSIKANSSLENDYYITTKIASSSMEKYNFIADVVYDNNPFTIELTNNSKECRFLTNQTIDTSKLEVKSIKAFKGKSESSNAIDSSLLGYYIFIGVMLALIVILGFGSTILHMINKRPIEIRSQKEVIENEKVD